MPDLSRDIEAGAGFTGTCDDPRVWYKPWTWLELGSGCSGVFTDKLAVNVQDVIKLAKSVAGNPKNTKAIVGDWNSSITSLISIGEAAGVLNPFTNLEIARAQASKALDECAVVLDTDSPTSEQTTSALVEGAKAFNLYGLSAQAELSKLDRLLKDLNLPSPIDSTWLKWAAFAAVLLGLGLLYLYSRK